MITGKRARHTGSNDDAQPRKSPRIDSNESMGNDHVSSPTPRKATKRVAMEYSSGRKQLKKQRRKEIKVKRTLGDLTIGYNDTEEANSFVPADDREPLGDVEALEESDISSGDDTSQEEPCISAPSEEYQEKESALWQHIDRVDAQLRAEAIMRNTKSEKPLPEGKSKTLRRDSGEYQTMRQRIVELESFKVTQMHIFAQRRREDAEKDKKIARLEALVEKYEGGDDGMRSRLQAQQVAIEELTYRNRLLTGALSSTAKLASRATLLAVGEPPFGQQQINEFTHPGHIARLLLQAEAARDNLQRTKEAAPATKTNSRDSPVKSDSKASPVSPEPEEKQEASEKIANEDQLQRERDSRVHERLLQNSPTIWRPVEIARMMAQGRVNTGSSFVEDFRAARDAATPAAPAASTSLSKGQDTRRDKEGTKSEQQKSLRETRARSRGGFVQAHMEKAMANSLNEL